MEFPFTELCEEVKAAKARNLVTLQESDDKCIKGAKINVDGGRKTNTPNEVKDAQTRLRMRDITGIANKGNEGLGLRKMKYYSNCNKKDKRSMIVKEIRGKEEERRIVHMTGLSKQGAKIR